MMFGSVCSGIEAATVAWAPLGWRAAWLAEIDKFASAVLAHHHPKVPNLGDMTKIARAILVGEVSAPDVLCGGTPCQAFSVAGLRESLADARGNLTLKFVEIANAIDHVRTGRGEDECIVFWENVPGVLSTKDNAFGCFLGGLAGEDGPLEPPGGKWANAGAVYGPTRAIAWRTLDAQYFGVAQRRRRVFVVASARKGFDPATVLFEWDGVRRDSAPSREAGQAVAPCVTAGAANGGKAHGARSGSAKDNLIIPVAFGGNNQSGPIDVATARNACASASGRMDFETETFLVQPTHTLRGEGFDASEDGTGRGTPLVPVAQQPIPIDMRQASRGATMTNNRADGSSGGAPGTGIGKSGDPAPTLSGSHVAAIAFDTTQITSQANRSNPKPGDPCHPLAAGQHAPAIAFPANLSGTQFASAEDLAPSMGSSNPTAVAFQSSQSGVRIGETHATLDANNGPRRHNGALVGMQVRRLTPEECEALQGFPSCYTAIPWRGKPADQCPDGPRYKALGNSWAVPNVAWLGRRIDAEVRRAS